MIYNLLLLVMLNIFTSCKSSKMEHNFIVTEYQRVGEMFQFSIDVLNYQGRKYMPIVSFEYSNDTLIAVLLYKSEGKICYSKSDLNSDRVFKQMLNLVENRKIELKENILIDNGKSYQILEFKKDSVFCMNKGNLILYYVKCQ